MNDRDIFTSLVFELSEALQPLELYLATAENFGRLIEEFGWPAPEGLAIEDVRSIFSLNDDFDNMHLLLDEITDSGDSVDFEVYSQLFNVLFAIATKVADLGKLGPQADMPTPLDSEEFWSTFPGELLEHLIILRFEFKLPALYGLFVALGLIEREFVSSPSAPERSPYWRLSFSWARFPRMIYDLPTVVREVYHWNDPSEPFDYIHLLDNLKPFFDIFGPTELMRPRPELINDYFTPDNPSLTRVQQLRTRLLHGFDYESGNFFNVYLSLLPVPPENESDLEPNGVALIPDIAGSIATDVLRIGAYQISLSGGLESAAGPRIKIWPNRINLESTSPTESRIAAAITLRRASSRPWFSFGEGGIFGFQAGTAQFVIQIYGELTDPELSAEMALEQISIRIDSSNGDSFIKKILPTSGINTEFDATIGISSSSGFYFRGSAKLDVTIPLHKVFGPIKLESIYLGISGNGSISVTVAASVGAQVGPITASVDRLGIKIPISFPANKDGNLGPLQIDMPQFKPPLGAGLAVSAGPVIGGGYLEFDSDNERYAGILQLKFSEIGIVAIALITTRMPDGSKGFSMLLILNVEFIPPIPLPYGFSIGAIGGLVGINRTMVLEVLREGVRNGTVDSILFPQDPIENAPRIISDLRAVFPPEEGRFVVGPMVRIGYGSPQFIYAEIAIIMEFPMPIRVALLGQLAAFFPLPDEAVVELHIDVLGTIETDKQLISIDATIYDSRILTYTLTGDAALRLKWGDNPVFATSLGGFHPKFSPPPNFPSLRRLRLSLGAGNNPRFNCDAYMALTSNSLQFGALVEVYASYGATLQGNLGFDALIYFSPFSFEAGLSGYVSAKYKGKKLAAIRLDLYLSGPTPWYAEGSATIEIPVFPDVDVHFEKTWGPSAPAIIEAVNPWDEFVAALNRPESWGSSLPAGRSMVESLRSLEEEEVAAGAGSTESPTPKPIVIHPAGALEVRQKVLPIDMRLYKFGNAPIAGHTKYNIEPGDFDHEYLEDYFARGQSEELSNADKVSKPSYELFKNGIAIRSQVTAFNDSLTQECTLEYESEYINEDNLTETSNSPGKLEGARVRRLLAGAASKRSPLRTSGRQKYARIGKAAKVSVGAEGYALVNAADMTKAALPAAGESMTRMATDEALRETIAQNPDLEGELLVVPTYEVAV